MWLRGSFLTVFSHGLPSGNTDFASEEFASRLLFQHLWIWIYLWGILSVSFQKVHREFKKLLYTMKYYWKGTDLSQLLWLLSPLTLSKVSQINKYHILIHMESRKMILMNLVGNRFVDTVREGEGGMNWESSIDSIYNIMCKMDSRKFLCNTGSPAGHSLMGGMETGEGGLRGRGYIYIKLWLIHVVCQKPTQHQRNFPSIKI